ncbi:hypothetical protein ACCS91_33325 [Rhizobium ruizarguesonis]|uniref:hypothetical protein n=1 Tax=Rhizobium ruizarguesonis TaxID=2081791 RepID=UPI001639A329|nr:hypothetical protein [Rhizobium ruizarguesonis]MBC2806571.1 hypothetical protein [Rhizobium ruizarguesonis]
MTSLADRISELKAEGKGLIEIKTILRREDLIRRTKTATTIDELKSIILELI